jgi:hypothetical protein
VSQAEDSPSAIPDPPPQTPIPPLAQAEPSNSDGPVPQAEGVTEYDALITAIDHLTTFVREGDGRRPREDYLTLLQLDHEVNALCQVTHLTLPRISYEGVGYDLAGTCAIPVMRSTGGCHIFRDRGWFLAMQGLRRTAELARDRCRRRQQEARIQNPHPATAVSTMLGWQGESPPIHLPELTDWFAKRVVWVRGWLFNPQAPLPAEYIDDMASALRNAPEDPDARLRWANECQLLYIQTLILTVHARLDELGLAEYPDWNNDPEGDKRWFFTANDHLSSLLKYLRQQGASSEAQADGGERKPPVPGQSGLPPLRCNLAVLQALLHAEMSAVDGGHTARWELSRIRQLPAIRSNAAKLGYCRPGEFTAATVTAIVDLLCIERELDQRAAYSMNLDAVAAFLASKANGTETDETASTSRRTEEADGDSDQSDDEQAERAALSPSRQKAYSQYLWALKQNAELDGGTDQQVYDWLGEHLEEGDKLPPCGSWSRYVREARSHHNTSKHTSRDDRDPGRSIVRPDQI